MYVTLCYHIQSVRYSILPYTMCSLHACMCTVSKTTRLIMRVHAAGTRKFCLVDARAGIIVRERGSVKSINDMVFIRADFGMHIFTKLSQTDT